MTTIQSLNEFQQGPNESFPAPDEMTVDQFASVHAAYMDAAATDLSPEARTGLAEDLNRLRLAHPNAYAGFQDRERLAREAQQSLLSTAAMQDVHYFTLGDTIGTKG